MKWLKVILKFHWKGSLGTEIDSMNPVESSNISFKDSKERILRLIMCQIFVSLRYYTFNHPFTVFARGKCDSPRFLTSKQFAPVFLYSLTQQWVMDRIKILHIPPWGVFVLPHTWLIWFWASILFHQLVTHTQGLDTKHTEVQAGGTLFWCGAQPCLSQKYWSSKPVH